jgi:hypothetical protein
VEQAQELAAIAKEKKRNCLFQNRRWDSDFKTVQKIYSEEVWAILWKPNSILIATIRFESKQHKPLMGAGILKFRTSFNRSGLVFIWATTIGFADIRITRAQSLVDDVLIFYMYYASFRVRIKAGFVREIIQYVIHGKKGCFKARGDGRDELKLG